MLLGGFAGLAAAGGQELPPVLPRERKSREYAFTFTAEEKAELAGLHGKAKKRRVRELKEKHAAEGTR